MPGAGGEKSRGTWTRSGGTGLREVEGAFWKLWGEKGWGLGTPYRAAAALEYRAPQVRDWGKKKTQRKKKKVRISGQN